MNSMGDGIFPDEVIIQILARLPIKSLFRMKAVCKLWYKLSLDKYFAQLYNEVSGKNSIILVEIADSSDLKSSLICVDKLRGVSEFSLDFLRDRVNIRASCNGLLCCSSILDKGVYYVCNPMTRKFRLLPRTRERPMTRFYPDGEATLVGLACDLTHSKFNVVLADFHRNFGHQPDGSLSFACFVFDSESNKWRKFISFLDVHFTHMNTNQVVCVNGALHWLTESCKSILVLDLSCDTWRKMPLPPEISYVSGDRVYLLDFDGCLSVIQISNSWMDILVLKNYCKCEWYMVDRVSVRCIRGLVPGLFPITLTGEHVLLATFKQVLVYNRTSRVWNEMYAVKNNSTWPLWFSSHAFRTTILSCH